MATLVSLPGSGFWNVPGPEGCVVMLQACRIQETLRKHMAKCKQNRFRPPRGPHQAEWTVVKHRRPLRGLLTVD